jgi:hypothetical protein
MTVFPEAALALASFYRRRTNYGERGAGDNQLTVKRPA